MMTPGGLWDGMKILSQLLAMLLVVLRLLVKVFGDAMQELR